MPVDAVEIAELGDHLAGLVDDDDLVFLIGANPNVVVAVDHDPVRGVDAGAENRRRSGAAVVIHRDLNDLMKGGVGDEQDRALIIELDAVGAERRRQTGSRPEQRTRAPRR